MMFYIQLLSIWCSVILFIGVYGESACDEVDILFVIDDASILAIGSDIIDFIEFIAEHDCSEYAGFSVNVYGNKIPNNFPDILLALVDTEIIHQRPPLIAMIRETLEPYFGVIQDQTSSNYNYKTVSLLDAFETLSTQIQPVREHHKYALCNDDPDCEIGIHDDSQRIFVFDYNNKLSIERNKILYEEWEQKYEEDKSIEKYEVIDSNVAMCTLLKYLENDDTTGEGLMIFEGQKLGDDEIVLVCDGEIPQLLRDQKHLFIEFTGTIMNNIELMEKIGSMTCPANINTKDGNLNLGNHVQWISEDKIIECNTKYSDNYDDDDINNKYSKLTSDSYIVVQDFIDDDMTFLTNDYLILDPNTFDSTPNECSLPVYKITRIETESDDQSNNYRILKLYVQIPSSPNEYIYDINVQGDDIEVLTAEDGDDISDIHDVGIDNYHGANERRRLFFNLGGGDDFQLFYMHFGDDFEYQKSKSYENNKKIGNKGSSNPKIRIAANGAITIKYGYGFELEIRLSYYFSWHAFSSDFHFEVKLYGFYRLYAYFTVSIEADLVVNIDDLLDWSKMFFFWIGPVPVLIRPFVNMGIELKMEPFKITAGIDCEYKESFAVGYYYDYHEVCDYRYYTSWCAAWCWSGCGTHYCVYCQGRCGWWSWGCNYRCRYCSWRGVEQSYPIKESTVERNSCEKILDISTGDGDGAENNCPAAEFGFTVTATLKIGASIYEALTIYLKGDLVFPFRITVPELDGRMCGYWSSFDMCSLNTLKASFTVALYLDLYVGFEFTLGQLIDKVWDLVWHGQDDMQNAVSFSGMELLIGHFDILPKTSLGCMDLHGILSPIESHYRGLCCGSGRRNYIVGGDNNNYVGGDLEICISSGQWSGSNAQIIARIYKQSTWYLLEDKNAFDYGGKCATFDVFKHIKSEWIFLDLVTCNSDDGLQIEAIKYWNTQLNEYKNVHSFYSIWNSNNTNSNCIANNGESFWLNNDSNSCTKISVYLPYGGLYQGALWIDNPCDYISSLPKVDAQNIKKKKYIEKSQKNKDALYCDNQYCYYK